MQVVIYGKRVKTEDKPYFQSLFNSLHEERINAYIYSPLLEELNTFVDFPGDIGIFENHLDFSIHKIDFVITLGGDGTILEAITKVRDFGIPILGINMGRLGFLASTEKKKIPEAIRKLKAEMYEIDERSLLFLESSHDIFGEEKYALNDFTISKRDSSSMITIHTYVNGDYLNTYWADGIIVATPTGSTGYSLSCGGPIIFPNSGNFVITPVAPHNLNVRPIVIPDDSVVSFEIEGRAENFLCTLDSRFEVITSEQNIAIRKADFNIKLAQIDGKDFMKTMRSKLNWGKDPRNY